MGTKPWRKSLTLIGGTWRRFFGDDGRLARLRALKGAIDPTGVIRSNHPVRR